MGKKNQGYKNQIHHQIIIISIIVLSYNPFRRIAKLIIIITRYPMPTYDLGSTFQQHRCQIKIFHPQLSQPNQLHKYLKSAHNNQIIDPDPPWKAQFVQNYLFIFLLIHLVVQFGVHTVEGAGDPGAVGGQPHQRNFSILCCVGKLRWSWGWCRLYMVKLRGQPHQWHFSILLF